MSLYLGQPEAAPPRREAAKSPKNAERQTVDAATLRFTSPELKTLFESVDAAARRVSQDNWWHQPFRNTQSNGFWYQAVWATRKPSWDKRGFMNGPVHYLQVNASPGTTAQDPKLIRTVVISAVHMPTQGWGARCDFTRRGGPKNDVIELTLYRCNSGKPNREMQFTNSRCGGDKVFGQYRYKFGASLRPTRGEKVVRSYLASPENFRDTALANLDRLEEAVHESFEKETLIRLAPYPANWSPRDGAPPPLPTDLEPLTDQQKTAMLRQALRQIAGRRATIRKHFRQMHAAAAKTFPLIDCLDTVE